MHILNTRRGGFALPTVLIASVVLLSVLVVVSTSVAAVRMSLKTQYYEQLAKSAGEAGVAYAKACLSKNSNIPLWTDAKPLMPNTDCAGNVQVDIETQCPSNERCGVVSTPLLRSSFKLKRPQVDGSGRAISLANTGYVEVLRKSNGAVWRTFMQPAVQTVAVPDLCSGSAASTLGWSNAAITTKQTPIPNAASARSISIGAGDVIAGSTYYRKDFPISEAGSYDISFVTDSASTEATVWVDGTSVAVSRGAYVSKPMSLTAGCHTITAKVTNMTVFASPAHLTAAVRKANAEPVVATDSSWRVTSGMAVSFTMPQFDAVPGAWVPVTNNGIPMSTYPAWTSKGGSTTTTYISASCVDLCPYDANTFFRDSSDLVLTASDDKNGDGVIEVMATTLCDNDCRVYLNDTKIIGSSPFNSGNTVIQQTALIPPGRYRLAAQLWNEGASNNPARMAIMLTNRENSGTILRETTTSWLTSSNIWTPGFSESSVPTSYEAGFSPSTF